MFYKRLSIPNQCIENAITRIAFLIADALNMEAVTYATASVLLDYIMYLGYLLY